MKRARALLLVPLLFAPAGADAADEAVGTVRGIYHQPARGVLVDARLGRGNAAMRWADVEIGPRRIIVQLPAQASFAVGDAVLVRESLPGVFAAAPISSSAGR